MDHYLRAITALIVSTRPVNVVHPVLLLYLGSLLVHAPLNRFWYSVVLLFAVHGGATILNDVMDRDVDKTNHLNVPINRGELSINVAQYVGYALLIIPLLVSLIFMPIFVTIALMALITLSTMYNMEPFRFSRRPIASIATLAVCYGFLPYFIGLSIGSGASFSLFLLGIFLTITRVSLSILKDYKDAVGDAQYDKQTFLLVFGRTKVRRISTLTSLIGNAGALVILYPLFSASWPIIFAIPLLVWIVSTHRKLAPHKSYAQLNHIAVACLNLQLVFDGLMVVWLTI